MTLLRRRKVARKDMQFIDYSAYIDSQLEGRFRKFQNDSDIEQKYNETVKSNTPCITQPNICNMDYGLHGKDTQRTLHNLLR